MFCKGVKYKKEGSDMSIIREMKKCPTCGKKYDFNPDVGNFRCPHCHGLGKLPPKRGGDVLKDILKGKRD